MKAHVAVLSVDLHLPASHSLKEKRWVLKSLKDRIRSKFNVSVAEIADLDKWQRCVLGISAIANDRGRLDGLMEEVLSLIEKVDDLQILDHQINIF